MKVLVAINNRPSSQATIDALVKMHWLDGTEIGLVTVFPPDDENTDSDAEPTTSVDEMENVAVEMRNALRQCEVSFFARYGDAKTEILEAAEQSRADLIVVGSNCKSSLERLLLGSVCQSILNGAKCPVVVAKSPCSLAREASPGFRTILVPIDNSVFSDASVHWLANFSWTPETRFIVFAAVAEDTDLEEVNRSLNKRAWNLAKLLNTDNVLTEIITGEPQQSIIELSEKYYADLIVMGSHGHSGLKQLILGSVSQAVSHAAPCAVAIVRGLARKDKSWQRTGVFNKLKPLAMQAPARSLRSDGGRNTAVHVMPGGF